MLRSVATLTTPKRTSTTTTTGTSKVTPNAMNIVITKPK